MSLLAGYEGTEHWMCPTWEQGGYYHAQEVIESPMSVLEEVSRSTEQELEEAVEFICQIKYTFRDRPRHYQDFLAVIQAHAAAQLTADQVKLRARELFKDHPILLDRFKRFLPATVS